MRNKAQLDQLRALQRIRDVQVQAAELAAAVARRDIGKAEAVVEAAARASRSTERAWAKSIAVNGHASPVTGAWAGNVLEQQHQQRLSEEKRANCRIVEQERAAALREATALRDVGAAAPRKLQTRASRKRDEQWLADSADRSAGGADDPGSPFETCWRARADGCSRQSSARHAFRDLARRSHIDCGQLDLWFLGARCVWT